MLYAMLLFFNHKDQDFLKNFEHIEIKFFINAIILLNKHLYQYLLRQILNMQDQQME